MLRIVDGGKPKYMPAFVHCWSLHRVLTLMFSFRLQRAPNDALNLVVWTMSSSHRPDPVTSNRSTSFMRSVTVKGPFQDFTFF
ncbi:hypothetical protein NPIL_100821 [Nephila pilipes]|uniref:Uncharacterized protein n=1 Tax=Nephila pilipes TaxID=299642 RepID=A0A8X6MF45_NEPPI|nr:hypothetical protein NPIL_100821 [Nephila pilipes]